MNYEEMKKTEREQKRKFGILLGLYAAYLLAGVLLVVTNVHCREDLPLYVIGGVIVTVCVVAVGVYESELRRRMKRRDR